MKRCIIIAAWSVALALSAFAQNPSLQSTTLVLEATIPGTPALDFVVRNQVAGRDFNGDDVSELFGVIDASTPYIFRIVDGTDFENQWTIVPDIGGDVLLDLSRAHMISFVTLDPAAPLKALVFAERQGRRYVHPVIIDAEGSLLWDGSGRALLAIGEGVERVERIVVFNPQVPQVEIWGVENN